MSFGNCTEYSSDFTLLAAHFFAQKTQTSDAELLCRRKWVWMLVYEILMREDKEHASLKFTAEFTFSVANSD